jgi:4-amino-4-deoxy-L-arabinose transferase-like glycosyltransferase
VPTAIAQAPGAPAIALRALRAHPVAALVLLGAAARLLVAWLVPLTTDEAYYVDWARHLQPGYLDHPPAVAWLLAAGLRLLDASTLGVRLPAVLLQAATTLLAASLARARGGERAALAATLLLSAAPVFSLGGALMTPDAPLACAWVGTLWALERAFSRGPGWLLAAGAFLGLGLLSKLTAGLLGVAALVALLSSARGRALLATPWPWLGALLAVALASPMLAWNAAHGWPALAFQAEHGLRGGGFSAARLAGSLGAQAAYVSPVLLLAAAAAAWRALRGPPEDRALALSALPVVTFFTAAAAFTPGALPHWPAPGWLSAALLLALAGSRWLRPAVATGLVLSALLLALLAAPLPGSPLDELSGWREGAAAARAAAGGRRLAAAHWMVLGQLGWADGRSPAYLGARRSGPTFYDPAPLAGREPLLLVLVDGLGEDRAALEARLGPLEPAGETEARQGGHLLRRYRFFRWGGAR